jgi:hypothetical protein
MPENKEIDVFEGGTIYLYYGTNHQIELGKTKELKMKRSLKQWIRQKFYYIKSFLR